MSRKASVSANADELSNDGDVELSGDELSTADTSDSGHSNDPSPRARSAKISSLAKRLPIQPPQVVATMCTMCDTSRSEYVCHQCGRLSFCLKCSVSLHDNKFLGNHKVLPVDGSSQEIGVAELRARLNRPQNLAREPPPPMPTGEVFADAREPSMHSDMGQMAAEAPLDLAALTADRRLIRVRVTEIKHCNDLLRRIGAKANVEKSECAEATRAAVEAVRRKFDILRSLIAAKEEEYVKLVETTGKKRLQMAAKQASAIAMTVSESDAFVSHITSTLDRMEGNHKVFNDSRRSMLEETQSNIISLDSRVNDFEIALEEIRSVSLGCPVPIQGVVEAIQALQAPESLSNALLLERNMDPIPAEKFTSTPGVQQWSANGVLVDSGDIISPKAQAEPNQRMSLAQEVELLRSKPLSALNESESNIVGSRGNSPARHNASAAAAAGPNQSIIAKVAARYKSPSSRGTPRPAPSGPPPELLNLKRQISRHRSSPIPSAITAAAAPLSKSLAPSLRLGTPTKRADSPASRSRASDTQTPGPGSYYVPQPFNARGPLSTPPRRGR